MFKGFLSPISFDFSLPLIFLSLLILQSEAVLFIQPKSVGNVKGGKQERVWDEGYRTEVLLILSSALIGSHAMT